VSIPVLQAADGGRGPDASAEPPVGRQDLLRRAREQLRGGPGVVFYGPAGIGKSRLLSALAAEAAADGATVLRAAPAEAELRLPFVCLIDLLGPVPDADIARLPPGLGTALRAALMRGEVPHSDQDRLKVQLAFLHLLRELSARTPVRLVVDDLQWVDRPTAQVLGFVARRTAGLPVRVLAAERVPDHGAPACADLVPPGTAELAVTPLPLADLAAVLERYTGAKQTPASARRIHRASGGNPFYALELARALPPDGGALLPGDLLPIPSRLRALLLRRLRELDGPTRSVLLLAATADRPTLTLLSRADTAAAAAEQPDGARHLATAERLGVVRVGPDGRIRFEHPLVRAAIYADASSRARRAAHALLADLVAEPVERARHLALALPSESEQVAVTLDAAAASARRRGAPATAAELAALAAQRTPVPWGGAGEVARRSAARRTERLLAAADYAYDAGLRDDSRRLAQQVLEQSTDPVYRTEARILLVRCTGQSIAEGGPIIARGLSEVAGDALLEARLWCWSASVEVCAGRVSAAEAHAREATRLARRAGDAAVEIVALTRLAHCHALTGDPAGEAALRRAFELAAHWRSGSGAQGGAGGQGAGAGEAERIRVLWEPVRRQAILDMQADRLEAAEKGLAALVERAADTVAVEDLCTILVTQTDVQVRAGECRAAMQSAHRALRLMEDLGESPAPVLFAAALAEAAGGSPADALRYAERGVRCARADGDKHGLVRTLTMLGKARLLAEDPAGAVEALREAVRLEQALGVTDPASGNWHADFAEALVAVGETDEAAALVAAVGAMARALGRRAVVAALDRSEALRLAALGRMGEAAALLRSAAERQADTPVERVRTLIALAQVERRRRHPGPARDAVAEAHRLAAAAGAAPWLVKAERERERLGEPLARPGWSGMRILTGAERRCAELAASGATNREIATTLFVSVKTVEATLSRSYRKLGVRSRTQLARILADATATGADAGPGLPVRLRVS
jgi:DNA-binding CsgD family transcriptional regulator/tetratricopeptide (TPR) repeat protein